MTIIDVTKPVKPVDALPVAPEGTPQYSPLWWCYQLSSRLQSEIPTLERYDRYADGEFDWPFVKSDKVKAAYNELIRNARSNFMGMVIESKTERLAVQGIRLNDTTDSAPDQETWDIWQANDLDLWAAVAYETALTTGRCYWSVWWPAKGSEPQIRIEDPTQVLTWASPETPRLTEAGVKVFVDEWTGDKFATVALPDTIHRFRWSEDRAAGPAWVERSDPERNQLGVVPWLPMVHRPKLKRPNGRSELESLIPIQDRINNTLVNRQVAEYLAAFRQKWATGLEIPTDEDGKPIQQFVAALTEIWVNEDPAGKFGTFDSAEISNYNAANAEDIQHIAIISATPRHYFTVSGQAPSGDSMKSAEAGLIARCLRIQRAWNYPQLEALRLARRIKGATDLAPNAELVWADPEYRTLSQLVDANVKLVQAEMITPSAGLEAIGKTPGFIARMERERLQTQLFADARTTPDPTAAPAV